MQPILQPCGGWAFSFLPGRTHGGIRFLSVELPIDKGGREMLVLGIDPGTAICGWGVVRQEGSRIKAIAYGAAQTTPDLDTAARLAIVYSAIDALIKEHRPTSSASNNSSSTKTSPPP
jgi:hypothetical protein